MGFYDCRCMVSGVSLKGSDAALVLLQQSVKEYRPIALAVTGNYNRLGTIDGLDEDDNTELLLKFFHDRLGDGAFVVDDEYFRSADEYSIEDLEQLLCAFERNLNDYDKTAVLNGSPVVYALVARPVWDAVVKADQGGGSATEQFRGLFGEVPVAEAIYRGSLSKVSRPLRELSAVNRFVAGRGIVWRPPDDFSQHYTDEMQEYLAEAEQTFRDTPFLLAALKAYRKDAADLLEDE